MSGVVLVDHPVLAHRVTQLRDRDTGGDTFRQLVSEVSGLLAYEALRDLGTTEVTVDTPVAPGAAGRRVSEMVLLVPSCEPDWVWSRPSRPLLPATEVAHVGLRPNETTLEADVYLQPAAPGICQVTTWSSM